MTDILMENNRLPMLNGDFQFVDELNEIIQQVVIALHTMYGDWLLEYLKGIDFVRDLRNMIFLDHDIKKQILGVKGVTGIKQYQRNFDRKTLTVQIIAVIKTIYGDFPINEAINK